MKTIKLSILLIVFVFFSNHTYANAHSGNTLYKFCTSNNSYENGFCHGHVSAIYQALISFNGKECELVKGKIPTEQLKDITIKHFRDNPEERHYDSFTTLFIVFGNIAKCIK